MEWVAACARSKEAHPVEIGDAMVSTLGGSKDSILKSLKKCSTLCEGVDYVHIAGTTYLSKAAFADILKITAYAGKDRQKARAVRVFKEFENVWKEEEGSLHGKRKDRGMQEEAPKKRRIEKVMDDALELKSICQQGVEHCKAFVSSLRNQVGVAKRIAKRGEHVLEDFLKVFNIDEGALEDHYDEEEKTVALGEGVQDANGDRHSFRGEHTATEKVGEDMGKEAGGEVEAEVAEKPPAAETEGDAVKLLEAAGGGRVGEKGAEEEAGGNVEAEVAEKPPAAETEGDAVKLVEAAGGDRVGEKAGGNVEAEVAEKPPVAETEGDDAVKLVEAAGGERVGERGEEPGDKETAGEDRDEGQETGLEERTGEEQGVEEEAGDSPTHAASSQLAKSARPGTSDKGTEPMERVVVKRVVGPVEAYAADIHRLIAIRLAERAAAEAKLNAVAQLRASLRPPQKKVHDCASAFTRWSPRAGVSETL